MIDWSEVVREHGPLVWKTSFRLLRSDADAADCFQTTFLAAFQLSNREQVRHWPAVLVRLATARSIERLRSNLGPNHRAEPLDEGNTTPDPRGDPVALTSASELSEALRLALARIDPLQAEVFCLACLDELPYRDIAVQLKRKTSHVGVLLHRAKAALKARASSLRPNNPHRVGGIVMSTQDPLDRATEALRNSAADANPPADLFATTLVALNTAGQHYNSDLSFTTRSQTRRKLMFRLMNAAAAIAVVAVTISLVPMRNTHASFEDVQAECTKAKNVQFTMIQKLTAASPKMEIRITSEGRKFRNDIGEFGSMIYDVDARKGVQVDRTNKSYRPEVINEQAYKRMPSFVDELRGLSAKEASKVSTEVVDGKPLDVFRLKKFKFFGMDNTKSNEDDGLLSVWVDPATKLPVKVEVRFAGVPNQPWSEITMKDFSWNVDLPAGFFDTTPPAGYKELPSLNPAPKK